jgi:hypothetical protein
VVQLLVVAIGVLVVVGLLVAARSRIGTDPASSVEAFHRALTAMEPGAVQERSGPDPDDDDEAHAEDRAHPAR